MTSGGDCGPETRRRGLRAAVTRTCAGVVAGVALAGFGLLARRWLMWVSVHGDSMAPELKHGDRALAIRVPPATIRRGQMVVGRIPPGFDDPEVAAHRPPYFVKRVLGVGGDLVTQPDGSQLRVPPGCYYVRGAAEFSVDSTTWGPIQADRLLGVVLARVGRGGSR